MSRFGNTTQKLSDTQLVILSAAAARDDLKVLPTPASLKAKGGALANVIKGLLSRGLIEEIPATQDDTEWCRDEDDNKLTLRLTDQGRWFEQLKSGKRTSIADIARREGREVSDVSRSITLAFLAPEIVEMILTGQQPVTLTAEKLRACRPILADWTAQKEHLFG